MASRSARGHPRLGGEITFGHRWCAAQAPQRNAALAVASWYVAETYLKVRGKWVNLYRPIDRHGNLIDAMLSEYRDMAAVKASCRVGGSPDSVGGRKGDDVGGQVTPLALFSYGGFSGQRSARPCLRTRSPAALALVACLFAMCA